MSFSFFFSISHLYFRKDDCADYSCMTEEVHDEALDGQDARGHISAEHCNYNFRCHIPSTSANPFKLEHPLAGEPQPRVRTFLWLVFVFRETCQQTCSRGDVVHFSTLLRVKAKPTSITFRRITRYGRIDPNATTHRRTPENTDKSLEIGHFQYTILQDIRGSPPAGMGTPPCQCQEVPSG